MKFRDLIQSINLPKQFYNSNFIMKEKFDEECEKFLDLLDEYDAEDFENMQQVEVKSAFAEMQREVKKIVTILDQVYDSYDKCDFKQAQILMDSLMEDIKEDLFFGDIYDNIHINFREENIYTSLRFGQTQRFYRIRAVNGRKKSIEDNVDEMFHIPISKRAISSNERFSLNGFPCLYLSTALPVAWMECGCPAEYYYSEFEYEDTQGTPLKILMLNSPAEIYNYGIALRYRDFELWLHIITRYLKTYPLILACSFVNHNGKVNFKQEYIVSQMLMQWIRRNIEEVQGVSYFTCVDDKILANSWCAHDIALPAIGEYDEKGYSKLLRNIFKISSPVYYKIPITNNSEVKDECRDIDILLNEISYLIRVYDLPAVYKDILLRMENVCQILLAIMEKTSNEDIGLILSTLRLLSYDIGNIPILEAEKIYIDLCEYKFLNIRSEDEIKQIKDRILKIYKHFIKYQDVVKKHMDLIWNVHVPHSSYCVLYKTDADKEMAEKKLTEKHLFYKPYQIEPSDEFIGKIRKLFEEADVDLKDVICDYDGTNEFLIKNFDKIPSVMYFKYNDVSIYSELGLKFLEYVGEELE